MNEFKNYGILKAVVSLSSCLFITLFTITNLHADYDDEEALIELYGDEEIISIATGTAQPISRAPAVATVISAKVIKEIGATDIDEALETVPGLHVSRRAAGYLPVYSFRGVFDQNNPQVLMLVNGISINNLFVGDRGQAWGGFPVESISRIEVIRGPGSALYGADAFAGVINIITKDGSEIDGVEFGSRLGSFDTRDVWALYGGDVAGFDVAFSVEFRDTDGQDEDIDSDAATAQGTSLAPGSVNTGTENFDTRLSISKDNWKFRTGFQQRSNFETGAGVAEALDPNGQFESDRWNVDLTYHNPNFTNAWDVAAQVSYLSTSQEVSDNLLLFPPGSVLFIPGVGFSPPFADGVIGNPEVWEEHIRYNLTGIFTGFDRHTIRTGIGYTHQEITKVKEESNFSPIGFGVLTDVSDTPFAFLPEKHRNNSFGFIQDVWQLSNDWELTAGLRYDDYNDFGDTLNPRLALVWAARHDLTAKLLYGEAFRAPSFAEFRNQNNPVANGNSELDPEEIETLELAFDYRPKDNLKLGLNLFRYEWDDIIRFTPDSATSLTAQNIGEQEGYGVEFEFDWTVNRELSLQGNYAFQESEDKDLNENSGNAPMHQFYVRANWEFLPDWYVSPQWNFVIDRDRVDGDARSDVDDYDIFDVTLRSRAFSNKWELALSARNLFNKRAFEPSQNGLAGAAIPGDLPLARRSVWGELRFIY
ncbi:MAG: TonB-dependent receptor plug domain-containing protein [Gammaproteobacteria bacterium]